MLLPFLPFNPASKPFLSNYCISKDHSLIYRLTADYIDPFSRSSQSQQYYGICDDYGQLLFMPVEYFPYGIPHSIDLEFYPTGLESGYSLSPEQSTTLQKQVAQSAKLTALKLRLQKAGLR